MISPASSVSFLSHHSYTSMVIVSHPFCKKPRSTSRPEFLAQFHPRTLRANTKFLLSTVHHDRLRTPGVRRIHSQWRACKPRPLWKVAEIARTREIRLGIRKRMRNASTPLLLVVISAIFVITSQQTFSASSTVINYFPSNWSA